MSAKMCFASKEVDELVMAREKTTTKIIFLASVLICAIAAALFCSDYVGDSNNHIINAVFAASVGEDGQNQLPSQQQQ
jgi:hypothetical protein